MPSGRAPLDHILRPRVAGVALVAALLLGCLGGGGRDDDGIPDARRAALARVIVENRTGQTLLISFRYAVAGGIVTVGRVEPESVAEMAPVPAEEPIVLIATGTGFERRLEPRSLEIDEVWTWVIRNDDRRR